MTEVDINDSEPDQAKNPSYGAGSESVIRSRQSGSDRGFIQYEVKFFVR
jgi:hypothetical protein